MEKIKILVFGFTNNFGGIENFYMNYYRRLDFEKYEIDFVTIYDDIVYKEEIEKHGNIYIVANYNKNPFKYYCQLKQIFQSKKYDIVHVNMMSCANNIPFKLAKKQDVKVIIAHSHNANVPKGILRKILNVYNRMKVLNDANCFLACSNKAGKWMFGKKRNFLVVPNQIDAEKYKFDYRLAVKHRKELNIEENDFVIGHIGRFSEQKNHDFIIEICKRLVKLNKRIVFVFVGDGAKKQKIIKNANKLNIMSNIRFVGMKSNANEYYNCFDCFILPSLFEGFPLVCIEAQFNGLKCFFSENITKEVVLNSNQCYFLPLEIDIWVKALLDNSNNYTRYKTYDARFDTKNNYLDDIYLKETNMR